MLQFTPESWTHVRWLDPKSTYMRFMAVCQLVIFWQVTHFLNYHFNDHLIRYRIKKVFSFISCYFFKTILNVEALTYILQLM